VIIFFYYKQENLEMDSGRIGRIFLHSTGAAVMIYGYTSLSRLGDFDAWMRAQYG
jgi:hypothetical protein